MEKVWTVLDSQPVLDSPWLHIDKQRVQTERGNVISDYYVAKKTSFTVTFVMTDEGKVLLLREYKHGIGDYVWSLPSGGIRAGESPEEAATRELLEETGYITDELKFIGSFAVHSGWLSDRAYLFIGMNARQVRAPRVERGESLTLHFKTQQDILEMARRGELGDPYSMTLVLYASLWP